MERIDQEHIDRFIEVTSLPTSIAIQKLVAFYINEHHGNLEDALDAFFIESSKSITQDVIPAASQNDVTGEDDPQSLKSITIQNLKEHHDNLEDALDAFYIEYFESITQDVIPAASQNDVTGVTDPQSLKSVATDENVPIEDKARIEVSGWSETRASAAIIMPDMPDETNDIEEDMIRAAIEASKVDMDLELERAISLSLQTAEEKEMGLDEIAEFQNLSIS